MVQRQVEVAAIPAPLDRSVRPDRVASGDATQCDLWLPPRKISLEDGTIKLLPALVITAAYSGFVTGRISPTRKTEDLSLGSWELIQQFGRVPRRLIWATDPTSATANVWPRGGPPSWALWPPSRCCCHRRTQNSRARSSGATDGRRPRSSPAAFTSPVDYNNQFSDWLARANARVVHTSKQHRSTWSMPIGRRCLRCRRSCCTWAGATRPSWAATTTSVWTPELLRRPDRDQPDCRRGR